jgi:cytochrome c oxidase subunit 3/cytochrome o ubiquinol oxidase subunit 3
MTVALQPALGARIGWQLPSKGRVAMACLIAAESAVFVIFLVAYLFYRGKSLSGPGPDILSPPVALSICLLSSSLTIHFAVGALKRSRETLFTVLWFFTIALGVVFLAGTALEWSHLIYGEGLTIQTNLFGTTYYSLVGLHAFHVSAGLLMMAFVLAFALLGWVKPLHTERLEIISLYWHFVDVVWVVVFTVVYLIGR